VFSNLLCEPPKKGLLFACPFVFLFQVSEPSKTKGIMFTHLCAYRLMCGFSFSSFLLRILYCVSYNNMVSTLIYINTCE